LWFKVNPGKKFTRLYLKKTHHKHRAGGVAQGAGPEFKPQNYQQQQKKKGHGGHGSPYLYSQLFGKQR
jgi:hypothetical protein